MHCWGKQKRRDHKSTWRCCVRFWAEFFLVTRSYRPGSAGSEIWRVRCVNLAGVYKTERGEEVRAEEDAAHRAKSSERFVTATSDTNGKVNARFSPQRGRHPSLVRGAPLFFDVVTSELLILCLLVINKREVRHPHCQRASKDQTENVPAGIFSRRPARTCNQPEAILNPSRKTICIKTCAEIDKIDLRRLFSL